VWGVVLYGAAMGWLEGVVVVYLRNLLGIASTVPMPDAPEVMRRMGSFSWLVRTEQSREVATLAMLAAVAFLSARRWSSRLGAFLLAFGVWDIVYYIALRVLVGWPDRLDSMDLLFLIPQHPWWYQPVWLPVAISCGMILTGVLLMQRPRKTRGPEA
jgi:hypothetical protein